MRKESISQFRKQHNLNQGELGELLDVKKATISAYERGFLRIPKWFEIKFEALATEMGIDYTIDVSRPVRVVPSEYKTRRNYKKKAIAVEKTKDLDNLDDMLKAVEEMQSKYLPPASNHYNAGQQDHIDVIKFAEANFSQEELIGFYRINAIKYLARFGKKDGQNIADLEKAIFYTNKLKELTQ